MGLRERGRGGDGHDFVSFFSISEMGNKSPQSLTFKVLYFFISNKFYYFGDTSN